MTTRQKPIDRLLGMLKFLRESPDGCPWTKEQGHASLLPHLIEEAYETADVIDQGKTGDDLRDELGDVLLQVVFHAQMASEYGAFTFDDVAQGICDKLERRYPTIFGDEPNTLKTPADIDRRWEEVKAEERRRKGIDPATESALDGISRALPALVRAQKVKGRAAKTGWDWPDAQSLFSKIQEEIEELRDELDAPTADKARIAAEIGDIMFLLVDLARKNGVDAEDALRTTTNRIEARFRHMEAGVRGLGKTIKTSTPEERKKFWNEMKAREKEAD